MAVDTLMAYVGVYDSVGAAEADYDVFKTLHTERGLIDAYDAAVASGATTARPRSSASTRRRRGWAVCSGAAWGSPPGSSSWCAGPRPTRCCRAWATTTATCGRPRSATPTRPSSAPPLGYSLDGLLGAIGA